MKAELAKWGKMMGLKQQCLTNPNVELFKQVIREDLPLLRLLATNGRSSE